MKERHELSKVFANKGEQAFILPALVAWMESSLTAFTILFLYFWYFIMKLQILKKLSTYVLLTCDVLGKQ